ncbi:zinc-finger domain-containing protein [Fodinicurvata sp. EGI_FJ10296]|jgi:uncharacterized Zn-finger protein|uniref:zinc-finger domain-containing protein n=1 Tax=Fodinicurvata sp. EGI_FJ10296 TaxID=3231908 RepID=UPI0034548895
MPIDAPEIIYVDEDTESVGCDGGGGALGHPLVYYTFGSSRSVTCGYCDREFVRGTPPADGAPIEIHQTTDR